jgi:hypothetical protein
MDAQRRGVLGSLWRRIDRNGATGTRVQDKEPGGVDSRPLVCHLSSQPSHTVDTRIGGAHNVKAHLPRLLRLNAPLRTPSHPPTHHCRIQQPLLSSTHLRMPLEHISVLCVHYHLPIPLYQPAASGAEGHVEVHHMRGAEAGHLCVRRGPTWGVYVSQYKRVLE